MLKGWNVMRLLNLLLGIAVIVQGIVSKDWLWVIIGVLLSLRSVFNVSCCGTAACKIPTSKEQQNQAGVFNETI